MGEDWSKGQDLGRNEERTVVEGFSYAQAGEAMEIGLERGQSYLTVGDREESHWSLRCLSRLLVVVMVVELQQPLEGAGPGLLGEPHLWSWSGRTP